MKTILIILSVICLGCSTLKAPKSKNVDEPSIVGKWQFEWSKLTGALDKKKFVPVNDSTYNLVIFFGSQTLSESIGKTIEFTDSNTILTNWIDQKMLDKIHFRYTMDPMNSLITFSAVSPKDSSKMYIPTKVTFKDSTMIWNIDDFFAIKLNKIK